MNNNYIISIPQDLNRIQSKLFFGLTKRQLIGFGIGLIAGILIFIFVQNINIDLAMYALFIVSAPIIFATIYQKDNMYIEQWIKILIEQKYLNPNKRYYKISKRNLRIAKERGLIDESIIKRKRQRNKKNESLSSVTATDQQKKKIKKQHTRYNEL